MQADPATLQLLSQTLTSTVSPDRATRGAAEAQLRQGETQPGFLLLILELVKSDQVELVVRQSAGVYFKNVVKRLWDPEEVSFPLPTYQAAANDIRALLLFPTRIRMRSKQALFPS